MAVQFYTLTHWGQVTHLYVSKLTSIASDNGLSPGRRQAIIWNNAWILLIGPLGTNFSEILIKIHTFSLKKIRLIMSSAKCRPFCLGLNELKASLKILCGLPGTSCRVHWGVTRLLQAWTTHGGRFSEGDKRWKGKYWYLGFCWPFAPSQNANWPGHLRKLSG